MAQVLGLALKNPTNFMGAFRQPCIQGDLFIGNTKVGWITDDIKSLTPMVMLDPNFKDEIKAIMDKSKKQSLFGTVFQDLLVLTKIQQEWENGSKKNCPITLCGTDNLGYSTMYCNSIEDANANINNFFKDGYEQVFVFTCPEDFIV